MRKKRMEQELNHPHFVGVRLSDIELELLDLSLIHIQMCIRDRNKPYDIIGIQVCIPGDQINKNFCKKLTIHLPLKDKEDEAEEII